jgi:hypothetical protein
MTSLFSYLITIFGVLFWFFRIIVAYCDTTGTSFICEPMNSQIEILILFLTVPLFVMILKRSLIGATLYLGIYGAYFGTAIYNTVKQFSDTADGIGMVDGMNMVAAVIGIIIPLLTFLDILFNKNRLSVSKDKDSDWYYKNEKYDREMDERADRNQYKIR